MRLIRVDLSRRSLPAGIPFPTLVLATALALTVLSGCNRGPDSASGVSQHASARIYSVHGAVRQLPDPQRAGVPLLIQHEAFVDFVNFRGEPSSMASMTMPFSVADGVDLAGLETGDKVRGSS